MLAEYWGVIFHQYVRWNTFWHWCNIQTDVRYWYWPTLGLHHFLILARCQNTTVTSSILADIMAMFHIGSILHQYGCATRATLPFPPLSFFLSLCTSVFQLTRSVERCKQGLAKPQPKSILVNFSLKIWRLVATIFMIFLRINFPNFIPSHYVNWFLMIGLYTQFV